MAWDLIQIRLVSPDLPEFHNRMLLAWIWWHRLHFLQFWRSNLRGEEGSHGDVANCARLGTDWPCHDYFFHLFSFLLALLCTWVKWTVARIDKMRLKQRWGGSYWEASWTYCSPSGAFDVPKFHSQWFYPSLPGYALIFRFPAAERPFILRVPQAPGTKVWFSFRKQTFAMQKTYIDVALTCVDFIHSFTCEPTWCGMMRWLWRCLGNREWHATFLVTQTVGHCRQTSSGVEYVKRVSALRSGSTKRRFIHVCPRRRPLRYIL